MTELATNTKYYVRAYATNIKGTNYGAQNVFTTQEGLPIVTTSEVTDVTAVAAICGGIVENDGGFEITARGVCWSASQNPTLSNSHTTNGTGSGSFTSNMTELSSYTTYYVRAYATNCNGTSYGEQKVFRTLFVAPEGGVNGLFSVSDTRQICFSQGNLQYKASTDTWRFATNQYDYIGDANINVSSTYSGWIDLYCWGTGDNPTITASTYHVYTSFNDWGNNSISNGGNQPHQWRSLTKDEWMYVFDVRSTTSGIRYVKAIVNGINGVILLPDDWSNSYYSLHSINISGANYSSNTISASQWNTLEQHGAVFLPAAGYRYVSVILVGSKGYYWSATDYAINSAYYLYFDDTYMFPACTDGCDNGYSVRLVCNVK